MNFHLQLLKAIFLILSLPSIANASIPENNAFFQVSSPSMQLCSSSFTYCSLDGLTIQTGSLSELKNALSDIKGLSTLDGIIHTNEVNWTANFPFAVYQIESHSILALPPKNTLSYEAPVPQQLIGNPHDLVLISGNNSYSGKFSVMLGYDQTTNIIQDFRFEAIVTSVPLPASIWFFGSVLIFLFRRH